MSSYASLVHLAWTAVAVNGAFALALLVMTMVACILINRTGMEEMDRAEKTLPTTLPGIAYSEIPIGAIVVIAKHKGIGLKDVVAVYAKDAMERKAIVQSTFNNDAVTSRFLHSKCKFMQHGYKGEALLLNSFDAPKYRDVTSEQSESTGVNLYSQQLYSTSRILPACNGAPGNQQPETTNGALSSVR